MQLRFKPSFLQLTPFRRLDEALASLRWGLGADCSGSSLPCLLFFYPQMIGEKWVNSAFRKTPLFKNCRCERLSLLYISKIEIYNPLSTLLLTLVCHFLPCASQSCHFRTQCCYSYILSKETKIIVHKNSFMENLPVQSCPIFYRTTLMYEENSMDFCITTLG